MIIIKTKKEMLAYRQKYANQKIGLVATMGSLHKGHLNLVDQIKDFCDLTVVSIFVNPSQFSQGEDYGQYPRNLDKDINQLEQLKVDAVFAPNEGEIYPELVNQNSNETNNLIRFNFGYLSTILCAKSRQNFITGVGLIVFKLFNIIKPNVAIFGQKDYQQFCVIKKINSDMHFDVKLVMAPIARDKNNLALSSRNQYLSKTARLKAAKIYQILQRVEAELNQWNFDSNDNLNHNLLDEIENIQNRAKHQLNKLGFETDYFSILNYPDLLPIHFQSKKFIVLIAAHLNRVRLIDNKIIQLNSN